MMQPAVHYSVKRSVAASFAMHAAFFALVLCVLRPVAQLSGGRGGGGPKGPGTSTSISLGGLSVFAGTSPGGPERRIDRSERETALSGGAIAIPRLAPTPRDTPVATPPPRRPSEALAPLKTPQPDAKRKIAVPLEKAQPDPVPTVESPAPPLRGELQFRPESSGLPTLPESTRGGATTNTPGGEVPVLPPGSATPGLGAGGGGAGPAGLGAGTGPVDGPGIGNAPIRTDVVLPQAYLDDVLARLGAHFVVPKNQKGTCLVGFRIARDGTLSGARVLQSSGYENLDKLAVRAVEATVRVASYAPHAALSAIGATVSFNFAPAE